MKRHLFLCILTSVVCANDKGACALDQPLCPTIDICACMYCLGPARSIANAPVRPYTCGGDWEITISGLYYKPHMDGVAFAIRNGTPETQGENTVVEKTLVDAAFLSPKFKWDCGFKLGLGRNTPCDGWDVGVIWTRFRGQADKTIDVQQDSETLLPLWFANASSTPTATDVRSTWDLNLDLVDLCLGREHWASSRLSLRPFIGLRYAKIDQSYRLQARGGSLDNASRLIDLDQPSTSFGLTAGLDPQWHLGCGWSLYGKAQTAVVYGHFDVDHKETNRLSLTPFTKTKILQTSDHFRASRTLLDLGLGIEWLALFSNCQYGVGVRLGWEQHLALHMNHLWTVNLLSATATNAAENVYAQRRGSLSIGGWSLSVQCDF